MQKETTAQTLRLVGWGLADISQSSQASKASSIQTDEWVKIKKQYQ